MKRSIFQIVGLLLLLPLFSGCNDSDDVAAIFTGKTWKLNYITVDGGHEMFGFWENEEQEKASIKELNKNGTYNICLLYTSPSPRDRTRSRMPSSA